MQNKDEFMGRESIQVTYSGLPVDSGLMDVQDLGPALISIGSLCRDTNKLLHGLDSEVSVRVRADFKKGSFKIDLELVKTLVEHARNLLTGKGDGLDTLIEILFGTAGLFYALKWLKGEKDPVTTSIEDGNLKIEVKGRNNHITVNAQVGTMLHDPKIRKSIDGIVRPLNKNGMESFSVKHGNRTLQTVKKSEAKYLLDDDVYVEDFTSAQDFVQTAYLEIIKLSFKEKHQWTFSDGSGTFHASIDDIDFMKKINKHEMFGKGDQLKVLLKTMTTKQSNGKYHTRRAIVQVLGIIRSRQTRMFEKD